MRAVDIIAKKRDCIELTDLEIDFFLNGYHQHTIPDYQMAALLMAIYTNGMTDKELFQFTKSMIQSGRELHFDEIQNFVVDKHSSGGVGDKITLALAPLLASLGISTAKLSGRGLGHTGGTIDKFESIQGFKFSLNDAELKEKMNSNFFGIMGASPDVVPLDKRIYNLRDVTATVGSIPLMVSSILSKKLALHTDLILLDLKVGSGAFISTIEEGRELANRMKRIAKMFNRQLICMLTNMDQPLGYTVGNLNELLESSATLRGEVDNDFSELLIQITSQIVLAKDSSLTSEEARRQVENKLKEKSAIPYFKRFIEQSGGSPEVLDDSYNAIFTRNSVEVKSNQSGYVSAIQAQILGDVAMKVGAGRETKEHDIDHQVGLIIHKKVGDKVNQGDVLLRIDYNSKFSQSLIEECLSSYTITQVPTEQPQVVFEIIK